MPIRVKIKQPKKGVENYLQDTLYVFDIKKLNSIAEKSLEKFKEASPNDFIKNNWSYSIGSNKHNLFLIFNNSAIQNGENTAILIEFGYMNSSGKWVPGEHYLEKPVRETYDEIIKETWEALKDL